MFQHHTGSEIKECILDVLQIYGIDLIQIYSTTTDNATNMLNCGRPMDDEIEESIENELEVESENDERNFLTQTMLEEKVVSSIQQLDLIILNTIRCGAHILALVIEYTLKRGEESIRRLNLVRKVAKKQRTPNLMLKLKE